MKNKIALLSLATLMASFAGAQSFVDGGFDSGNLNAWTVTPTGNGTTNFQLVTPIDIDGGGALGVSNAGDFSVGQVTFNSGVPEGIYLTQTLNLTSGLTYTLSFNWSAQRTTTQGNVQGGIFDLVVNGASLAHAEAGSTDLNNPHYGFLSANFTANATGAYKIGALITRPFQVPADNTMHQYVDNFNITPEPASLVALGCGLVAVMRRRRR